MTFFVLNFAAFLTIMIGGIHSFLGEKRLIGPLLSPEYRKGMLASSAFARQVLRFAWHLTTITWWGIAAILVALAWAPLDHTGYIVLSIIGVIFGLLGTITLIAGRGRHLAWIIFYMIAVLSIIPLL